MRVSDLATQLRGITSADNAVKTGDHAVELEYLEVHMHVEGGFIQGNEPRTRMLPAAA
jgi:hypothetical protein